MPNRLADEASPYLRQHADNPVDWYPWSDEAFHKAREEDKPVFLSIGYAACHWCHVMERESFADPETAEVLNRDFVAIKVDREERPDLDGIYSDAVMAMAQIGGWPLSVFLTPDRAPFYGGTYFPAVSAHGLPAFKDVLTSVSDAWRHRRTEIDSSGADLVAALGRPELPDELKRDKKLGSKPIDEAVPWLAKLFFEGERWGFGEAPRFPQPMLLDFLLAQFVRAHVMQAMVMARTVLDQMAEGGIQDAIGGGFHRYAVDEDWRTPHFEKMLYDNAQLARTYLHAYQVDVSEYWRDIATSTLDYMLRELRDAAGGFYSSQDADSEGQEGRYYTWSADEIVEALQEDAGRSGATLAASDIDLVMLAFGATREGNFEDGRNALFGPALAENLARNMNAPVDEMAERVERLRKALFLAREQRPKPAVDEKVVAAWNGLALSAFAEAARVLGRSDYLDAAKALAELLVEKMRTADGRMMRYWRAGQAVGVGFLEDHASVALGLLQLYQSTFDERWFAIAAQLAEVILEHFADPDGGFFDTADDHEPLIARPKRIQDLATPSGGAMATLLLVQLGAYTGESRYLESARAALSEVQGALEDAPLVFAYWLAALESYQESVQLAVVGPSPEPLLGVATTTYRPDLLLAAGPGTAEVSSQVPLLESKTPVDGRATAYVCKGFACGPPTTDPSELAELLEG